MTDREAHNGNPGLWDIYLGIVAVAVAAATLTLDGFAPGRRLIAVTAIAAMAVLHLVFGRRLTRADPEGRSARLVLLVQVALFAVAVFAVPFTTWLLFAITPLIFMLAPLRTAVVLVVIANLVPVAAVAVLNPPEVLPQLLISAISCAAGLWLGFWIVRVIEQNIERGQLIERLEASQAEVARLSHEAGVGAERARLAGEIHDTLAQGFTSIITLLQAADPSLADERLALAVRTAKENLAEARALVAALSPSALAAGSLPDSVRRQASRFAEETGTPATFRLTGDERELPTAVAVVVLRAAQEALTNVRRHAGAQSAAVLLAYSETSVRLVVRDDGRGFVPGAADGFGLSGMRARAAQVNGTLSVHSDPSLGTTIELEVPS
ncbi:MAG: sensor histidine kinase [Actinoplanes sp.]